MILGQELAEKIAGLSEKALHDPIGAMCGTQGLRLIPYHGVGVNGMLLAMRCDSVTIGGQTAGNLVAFMPKSFPDGEYQALTGGIYG